MLLGDIACFDCRISQLPNQERVIDYFRWRNEDAHRNALSAHCYWALRGEGSSATDATSRISGLSTPKKNELLFSVRSINFNEIPRWHRRGSGLYWEDYEKESTNARTGEAVTATRRRLKRDLELPMKDEYSEFVRALSR